MANATASSNGRKSPDSAEIAAQLETVKADLAELTAVMQQYATAQGAQARDRVVDSAHAAGEAARLRAEETAAAARETATKAADQTNEMIRENPATAVGLAAGVGFLVGFLSARR